MAGALLAFFSLSWPQSLKSALRLSPRPVEAQAAKPGGDGEPPSRDLRWHLVDGWRDSSSCPDHGWQDSIPGHIADLLYALHECAGARCCGCCARLFSALLAMLCEPPLLSLPSGVAFFSRCQRCALPTGLLLLLPTYYALAIVARLGPLPFSCFLLGATIDIHAPSTVAAISIAVLLALTARSIFRELRQVDDIKDYLIDMCNSHEPSSDLGCSDDLKKCWCATGNLLDVSTLSLNIVVAVRTL